MNPHDLLRLADDTPAFADAPSWVAASLERARIVVVRRANDFENCVAIGIRGAARSERFGSWLDRAFIFDVLSPEMLLSRHPAAAHSSLPAFGLLHAVTPICDASGLAWGPTGSVGFELASECAMVTENSDLDLLMRAPEPVSRSNAQALFQALSDAANEYATRIDVQIETRAGAFSLAEFAHGATRVMLRTANGPKLVGDPWLASRAA